MGAPKCCVILNKSPPLSGLSLHSLSLFCEPRGAFQMEGVLLLFLMVTSLLFKKKTKRRVVKVTHLEPRRPGFKSWLCHFPPV